jgi:ribose transport system permease protein
MESNMANATATVSRRENGLRHFISENTELVTIYGIMVLILIVGAVSSPDFRTPQNGFNVLRQAVALGLVSVGQTMVILAAGIDLSVGATISLIAVYTSGLMDGRPGLGVVVPILLLMIAISQLIGFVNALVINELKVAPFIATLGTGSIIQGFVLLYAKAPTGRISPGWDYFAEGMIGPVPFPVIFLTLLVTIAALLLSKTTLGRHLVATGGSEEIARLSGIRTKRIIFFAYMFCSFTAALSGLFLTSRMAIGDPLAGGLNYDRFDLDSIAAVLIGGTRLGGGKGSVLGTVAGVLILSLLNNIFNLVGVSTFYQWGIKGLIILGAVTVYTIRTPGNR